CHTCVEPAKHRNSVPEWKQSTERKQYSERTQSPERKQFPKWKQPSAARLAKTRFRSPLRGLAWRLEPQLRPLVEWSPMLLHQWNVGDLQSGIFSVVAFVLPGRLLLRLWLSE